MNREGTARQYIIVIGCGSLGSHLANHFSREGHSVVVIDIEEEAFKMLSQEYSGFRLEGDATELALLKQAKINLADLVIAATQQDNTNLMVAQIAKKIFSVPRVIARVIDQQRETVYRQQGIDTVCPTSAAADILLGLVTSFRNSERRD